MTLIVGLLAAVVAQIATIATIVINARIANKRDVQQRQWDLEDRQRTSSALAQHLEHTGDRLAAAIADNTRKTEGAAEAAKDALHEANNTNDKIAAALGQRAWDGPLRVLGPAARVFVVDDNPVSRKLTRLILLGAGYVVEAAPSGEDAIEELSVKNRVLPDLVLIDLNMPTMDGCQTAHCLREKGFRMPILAHTGFAADPQKCYDSGFDGFIEKSGDLDLLPRIIAQHLRIQRMQKDTEEPLPPMPAMPPLPTPTDNSK